MSNKENQPTEIKKPAQMGPTRKRKNTYIVQIEGIIGNLSLFQGCKNTVMPVVEKNGQPTQKPGSWLRCTAFPNPSAHYLVAEYASIKPVMGKLASTIIEYLDKETGKPVVSVYPQSVYIHDGYNESDFNKHLNHASRRDFEYQIKLRNRLLAQADENTRK